MLACASRDCFRRGSWASRLLLDLFSPVSWPAKLGNNYLAYFVFAQVLLLYFFSPLPPYEQECCKAFDSGADDRDSHLDWKGLARNGTWMWKDISFLTLSLSMLCSLQISALSKG
jgi:hypothetical protein